MHVGGVSYWAAILDLVSIQLQSKIAASKNGQKCVFRAFHSKSTPTLKVILPTITVKPRKTSITKSFLPANLAKKCHLFFMSISVRDIKSVPQPTVPLFNPSEIQLGKEDSSRASLTAQPLPSKGRD